MDRKGKNWGWLPTQMPGVAKLIASKKIELGAEWVNTCWRRGVVDAEPGWFYASEGALAVGAPWPEVLDIACARVTSTQALVILRPKGVAA